MAQKQPGRFSAADLFQFLSHLCWHALFLARNAGPLIRATGTGRHFLIDKRVQLKAANTQAPLAMAASVLALAVIGKHGIYGTMLNGALGQMRHCSCS